MICSDSCHRPRYPGLLGPTALRESGAGGCRALCGWSPGPRWLSPSVHKPHAAMAPVSSCMGSTFRAPWPKGAPFVCVNVSPSIKTDMKYLNTNRFKLSCKSCCKKIVLLLFLGHWIIIQSKKREEIHALHGINAFPPTLMSGRVGESSHAVMCLLSADTVQRI